MGPDPLTGRETILVRGRRNLTYKDNVASVVLKQMPFRLVIGVNPRCQRLACTLAPPDKYG